ncbi:transcription factor E2F8-like isoform X2 [Acanthaster planci]|uniref:Transcription factor E2F8-like isoform X2 n=1 Tax=Acanthaster planci TaxID=133434 RepID=A0A8B8A2L2_ACAPL|nr:transcription factor E2F8-like isoform X2 [Acanthaster planci]
MAQGIKHIFHDWKMADLASSMSSFLFPEGFQPLDGCDEDLNTEPVIRLSSFQQHNQMEKGDKTLSVSFQEPLSDENPFLVGQEVAVQMEPEVSPSTPNKPSGLLPCLSPLTPTTNLKVLISAASPEIRGLDSRRQLALFSAVTDHTSLQEEQVVVAGMGDMQEEEVETDCMSQGEDGVEEGDKPINRKAKSLGLLCQRFLSRYPDYPKNGVAMAISLDAISKDLGVERRRIYDIVNVLESIEMVSRVAKNKYLWHGKMNMESTLARLKCLGEKKRYADQIAHLKKLQIQSEFSDEMEQLSKQPFRDVSNIGCQPQDTDDKKERDMIEEDMNNRRDKSLGVMSQKFIMLFLVSQAKVITLDIAARVLIGDINYEIREGSKFKTKVRRLYDIANILTSLEMIKKVHVQEGRGRKPAFRWIGPNPDTNHVNLSDVCVENAAPSRQSFFSTPAAPIATLPPQETQPSSKPPTSHSRGPKKVAWSRHASFNAICEVVERERRSYSSAPNSPTKDSQDDKSPKTPTDEKFRKEFEALRSKYPDQMSQIYVTEKQSAPDEDAGTPNRPCPSTCVPMTSPKCTPGNTAGVTPLNAKVIVSPLPGSLPIGTSQRVTTTIPVPVSFSVFKPDPKENNSPEAIPSPGRASEPSSSQAKSALGGPAAKAPGQYSLLTDTVNALHMVLRNPDTIRRSKRTIKQPNSCEFEYQPVVKRSKMELEAALALQRGRQDLPSQTQYLKIPVDGKLLQQTTGKPMQTVIIRREISVLHKNSPLSVSVAGQDLIARGNTSGKPQAPITATLVPGTILKGEQPGLAGPRQAIFVNHVAALPIKTVTLKHHAPHDVPCDSPPQPAPQGLHTDQDAKLLCVEQLSDTDEIMASQQPFHEVECEKTVHCADQGRQQGSQQHMERKLDEKDN